MADFGAGERSARRILIASAALLIVVVAVVNVVLQLPTPHAAYPLWYTASAWSTAAVTVMAGVSARWLPDALLRVGAASAVTGYGVVLIGFPLAAPGGLDRMPWLLTATGSAAAAALVAGGPRLAWTITLAGAGGGLAYRMVYGGLDLDGIVNDTHAMLTSAAICAIGGYVLSIGRGLDAAAAATSAAVSQEAAERGRLAARTKAAALVHDEVLATLNLAASDLPLPQGRLAEQAEAAARMVVQLASEGSAEPQQLSAALAELARQAGATFSQLGGGVGQPSDAASDALIGAARQALRNSVRHAPTAARRMLLIGDENYVRVEVSDDGPGFDPDAVAGDRLGVRQSIIARMSRIPGGQARVVSAPGRGTSVVLQCASSAAREWNESGDERALSRDVGIIAVFFVTLQSICAVTAAVVDPPTAALQIVLLLLACAGGASLLRSPTGRTSRARKATIAALSLLGVLSGLSVVPYSYGTLWFVVAVTFLFVALALRGSIRLALGATAVLVVAVVVAGVLHGAPAEQIVQASTRPVTLVVVAALILVIVERMRARIVALHAEAVASAEHQSWTFAARAELTARMAELARGVVPILRRIAGGAASTVEERREYATLEGELRDSLRAGHLGREPLVSAVAAARERGVDVVLLDDSAHHVAEDELVPLVAWMATAVGTARTSAVGRLLPAGRAGVASVTIDGRLAVYDVTDHGSALNSFQGE